MSKLGRTADLACHTDWFPDSQQKLENLVDAVSVLSAELDQAVRPAVNETTTSPLLITPVHVLSICYITLHMVKLPDALQRQDLWETLFNGLSHLGHQSLDHLSSPEPVTDQASDGSSADVATLDKSLDEIISDGRRLVHGCLEQVQKKDIHCLQGADENRRGPVASKNSSKFELVQGVDDLIQERFGRQGMAFGGFAGESMPQGITPDHSILGGQDRDPLIPERT